MHAHNIKKLRNQADIEGEKMIWEDFTAILTAGHACEFVDSSLGTGLRDD